MPQVCDLGEFAQFVVPPTCVKVKATRTVPRRLTVSEVSPPPQGAEGRQWSPLIVLGRQRGYTLVDRVRYTDNGAEHTKRAGVVTDRKNWSLLKLKN